jgi:hypothetical protein
VEPYTNLFDIPEEIAVFNGDSERFFEHTLYFDEDGLQIPKAVSSEWKLLIKDKRDLFAAV